MAQKVYTRKGDKGYTSVMGTTNRYKKCDPRIDAIGTIDELNCYVGMVRAYNMNSHDNTLRLIQNDLFGIGSALADVNRNSYHLKYQLPIEEMEEIMDNMSTQLEPLKNFILPGGSQLVSFCHLARTVCRRAERCLTSIDNIDDSILKYINRLSDYFFVLSRKVCEENNIEEVIWTNGKERLVGWII